MYSITTECRRLLRLSFPLLFLIPPVQAQTLVSAGLPPAETAVRQPERKSLKIVLSEIEQRYGVHFVYEGDLLEDKTVPYNISSTGKLDPLLKSLLAPAHLRFRKMGNKIYAILPNQRLDAGAPVQPASSLNRQGDSSPEVVTGVAGMQSLASTLKKVLEELPVSGKVTDDKGQPLPGVSILVKGTTNGTTTDGEGRYKLNAPNDAVLVFSFIGYLSEEVPVNNRTVLDISLVTDIKSLSEVVVVGYGTQAKREVTGAVSSVNSKDINQVAVTGLDQALQGRMAGVQVTQNSGEPGGSVSVRIRGVGSLNAGNEPLYVVDGVPLVNLNTINPNDIERIDVLKDAASAAIYGSRGTNGVVLVTTKRGKLGKLTVNLDAYAGVQRAGRKIDLLNGPQFARLANENLANAGLPTNPAWDNPESQPSYDWQDAIFQTSPIQNYNVTVSGGGEKSRSLFAAGYFRQGGIIKGSDFTRYTGRFNTDYDLTKKLKLGASVNLSYTTKEQINTENNFSGALINAAQMQPVNPIFTSQNGLINDNLFGWEGYAFIPKTANVNWYPGGLNNPVHTVKDYIRQPQNQFQVLAAAYGEYEILKGLSFRSSLNLVLANQLSANSLRKAPGEIDAIGQYRSVSTYSEYWDRSQQWNWINTLSYTQAIGQHHFSLIAGTDALRNKDRFINANAAGAPDDQVSISASSGTGRVVAGAPSDNSLVSYIGRVTYDFAGKYLLTANFRRDGSSKFGSVYKYGNFPSASVGWRLSEEGFMQSFAFLDELKLRVSYGIVGNQNIGNFRYLNTYYNDAGTYQYVLGASQGVVPALYANNIGDPAIRWEKSIQTNFGLDASFLNGKFTLTADYYRKQLEDLLGYVPIPQYTGVYGGTVFRNGFSMENRGLELAAGYTQPLGRVTFSANANFSTLDNKLTKLFGSEKSYVAQSVSASDGPFNDDNAQTRSQVGQRIANFYGYVTDGIFQNQAEVDQGGMSDVAPGDRRYKDLNNDGKIDVNDKTVLGNGLPKYIYGLNLKAEYWNFDLSVFLNGQAGVQIANMTQFYLHHMHYYNSPGLVNGSTRLLESWRGEGTSNDMPRNSYDAPTSNRFFSSSYIENGAFLRIRNLQLGYNVPKPFASRFGLEGARVYVAAQNLYTFTKYSGYDPEIGSANVNGGSNQSPLTTGVDYGRYPVPRMLMGGINIQF